MEGRELPVGWEQASLAELVDRIEAGKNFRCIERPPLNGEIGIVKVSAVSWGRFREEESKTVPPGVALDSETRIHQGDLLFSRANTIELVGACVMVKSLSKDLRLSDKILRLVPSEEAVKPWIYRYLSSPKARKYLSETSSGNQLSMRNVSQRVLLETLVPLAPLNEQRRIAAKLDSTLAAVEACRQRLDGVAAILKRFRLAVLAAATSGELTREWREERGIGHQLFKKYSLKDLVQEPLRNGKSVRDGEGDYVLRLSCLKSDSVDWTKSKQGNWEGIAVERFLIHQGDFLVARGNGSKSLVGRGCLVDEPPPRMAFPDTMIRIRPDQSKIHPVYLSIAWEHRSTRDQIESSARTSAGIWKVAQSDLEVIQISIPGQYEEQVEVVRRAQHLFTLADQLEARLNSARKVVDRLTPALLAKAFRGDLVPQDPTDEPASVLLERIRAARQAEAGAGKPSRRGRPKAAANPAPVDRNAAPDPSEPLPPDLLTQLLRECGALSERALLAASELEPGRFTEQLQLELQAGKIREELEKGERVLVVGG